MDIFDETLQMNRSLAGTFGNLVDVVPSDSVELAQPAAKLYIETGGALVVRPLNGANTVTVQVPDFSEFPLNVAQVFATGTTASGIKAFVV
jgi:hypothetical protein